VIVRIFKLGTSNGEAPVNYLLSMKDHTGQPRDVAPEVLEGHPATTIAVINAIHRKHRYVSGVLAFRDDEKPTRAQMYEVMDAFKKTVVPGLSDRQFNSLFVLHREKGNTEIHLVVPMIEFATGRGKRLNIHPPGARNLALYEAFTQVMNHKLGYGQVVPDPMRAAISVTDRKLPSSKGKRRSAHLLQHEIVQAVQAGQVNNRKELVQWLDEALGVTATREGRDYLSVKMPGATKAMRLRGPLFEADTDYRSLAQPKRGKPGTVMLTVPEYQKALASLDTLVSERRAFNIKAYLTPRTSPRTQGAGSASATLKPANFTRATTKEKPMPQEDTPHRAHRGRCDDHCQAGRRRTYQKARDREHRAGHATHEGSARVWHHGRITGAVHGHGHDQQHSGGHRCLAAVHQCCRGRHGECDNAGRSEEGSAALDGAHGADGAIGAAVAGREGQAGE